uniref:C2H2-type domain-containing protein n=1 Tax=Poecilia latipinna TaxID=48699 RepID=A0A3B3U3S5_9TELE
RRMFPAPVTAPWIQPGRNVSPCSECGKQFLDEQSLRRHMRRNTEKNSSDCSCLPLDCLPSHLRLMIFYKTEIRML